MNVHIRNRTGKVSDRQREYIETKLERLERYLEDTGDVQVELTKTQQRGAGEIHTVQATVHTPQGTILRAEERDPVLFAAVDAIHDHLQRQMTRFKDKHYRRGRTRRIGDDVVDGARNGDQPQTLDGEPLSPQLVRTKMFTLKPMYSDEAIEQMELLGHTFFVFTDADTDSVNVVYRRRDGNYGLIVPNDA